MKKSIHPAIEEIHEVRRILFKRFNRDTQTFGKYLAERQRLHRKAGSRKVKVPPNPTLKHLRLDHCAERMIHRLMKLLDFIRNLFWNADADITADGIHPSA
jgi:hypothetical protein